MKLLKKASNQQAYGKISLQGFAKAGKTYTATQIAIGLAQMIGSKKDIAFLDTETGSDFMIPLVKASGYDLLVAKTRAFKDLLEITREAEKEVDILIIDSISHVWLDLIESYMSKKGKKSLAFQDWGVIKPTWRQYTDLYLTSRLHIICCGRSTFEWDYFENDDGKMELYKSGTKMRAETEFSYEPSLLIEMERIKENKQFKHRATVLGDRANLLDGKSCDNPTFDFFKPHFQFLAIGGEHMPLDVSRSSEDMFDIEGKPEWKKEKEMKEVRLEEIDAIYTKYFPGSSAKEKKAKGDLAEFVFKTRSWKQVTLLPLNELNAAYKQLQDILGIDDNVKRLLGDMEGEVQFPGPDEPVKTASSLTELQQQVAEADVVFGEQLMNEAWELAGLPKELMYKDMSNEQCNKFLAEINRLADQKAA